MKIEPHTLKSFFEQFSNNSPVDSNNIHSQQIQIPIYQRKYCWNTKIVKKFHMDLVAGSAFGHHIGKLFFQKKKNGERVCIDGQQRLTTLLIGICALRDIVLELSESESIGKVLDEIHSIIFVKQVDLKSLQEEYLSSKDMYGKASEIAKDISRLIPSHDDRVSYIEILIGLSGNNSNSFQNSNMHNTREIFYKLFKSQVMKNDGRKLRMIEHTILPNITVNGKFVIVEYEESEINAQERFGELYNVGKSNQILFHIKTPGIDLSYSDLIKNYLLSKLEETRQLQVYENYWLVLERLFISDSGHQSIDELSSRRLDHYLEWYLYFFIYSETERKEKYAERKKKIEEFERLPLIQKLGMCGKETNFTLYSQFVNGISNYSNVNIEQLLSNMIKQVELYLKEM